MVGTVDEGILGSLYFKYLYNLIFLLLTREDKIELSNAKRIELKGHKARVLNLRVSRKLRAPLNNAGS